MDDNQNSNPFDEDEKDSKWSNAPIGIDESPTFSSMDEEESTGKTVRLILLISGIAGCCIVAILSYIFFQPATPPLIAKLFPATATRTPNMTATQRVVILTNTAQAVETIAADASERWEIVFSDSFDKESSHWRTGVDDDEYATIIRTIEGGKYQWDVTSKKAFVSWLFPITKNVSDFYLATDAERLDDFDGSDYGLAFRRNAKNDFYYFGIDRGSFIVALHFNGGWSDLITWTKTTAILPDKINRLTVIAQGSHFIFLINGRRVGEASNDKVKNGTVALALQVHSENRQAIIAFDNFELRTP